MILEEAIDYVNSAGLVVNNLFQLRDGTWQANLRGFVENSKGEYFFEFGKGSNPVRALTNALDKAEAELD